MMFRVFKHALDFYLNKVWVITIFAIPFLLSALLLMLVAPPTYLSLGQLYLRTGSLPDISLLELLLTIVVYAVALFISVDAAVNIGVVVKSKRTFTHITTEIVLAAKKYASRLFFIYTFALLILLSTQLLTYDHPLKEIFVALVSIALASTLFFTMPAIIIDDLDIISAIKRSIKMLQKFWDFIVIWAVSYFLLILMIESLLFFIIPTPYSPLLVFLLNGLIIVPFFLVLQMQMYMEKYPLAR